LNTVWLPLSAVHPPPPYRRGFAAQRQRLRAAKREARRQKREAQRPEREARRQQQRRRYDCTNEELADILSGLDGAATCTTQVSISLQAGGRSTSPCLQICLSEYSTAKRSVA